jgi:hypothetical protein
MQGVVVGLFRTPPCTTPSAAGCEWAQAKHTELSTSTSTIKVAATGPAAPAPRRPVSKGRPRKPVFGKAVTRAANPLSRRLKPCCTPQTKPRPTTTAPAMP